MTLPLKLKKYIEMLLVCGSSLVISGRSWANETSSIGHFPNPLTGQYYKGEILAEPETHWGQVTLICISRLAIVGSDNGLLAGWCQVIIWTDARILLMQTLGTKFSEILIKIHTFSFKKIYLKMSSGKWWPYCLSLNVLKTYSVCSCSILLNTLRPRQNGHHFADDVFKCIFLNGNLWILIKISLKFAPKGSINNIPALVQIMAWRRIGDKPLSEPMMA